MRLNESLPPAEKRVFVLAVLLPLALAAHAAADGRGYEAAFLIGVVGLWISLGYRFACTRARLEEQIWNAKQIAHDIRSPLTVIGLLATTRGAKSEEEAVALGEATSRVLILCDELLRPERPTESPGESR